MTLDVRNVIVLRKVPEEPYFTVEEDVSCSFTGIVNTTDFVPP